MLRPTTRSPLFPYTTLFRSHRGRGHPGRPFRGRLGITMRRILALSLLGSLAAEERQGEEDRKSTRLNSSHANSSYAAFCLQKKNSVVVAVNRYDVTKTCRHQ